VEVEAGHPRQLFRLTDGGRQSTMELSCRWTLFAEGMNRMLGVLNAPSEGCKTPEQRLGQALHVQIQREQAAIL
jgi:hypothetical protein